MKIKVCILSLVNLFCADIFVSGTFRELTNTAFNRTGKAGGIAVSDLDNDGTAEVIIAIFDGPNKILKYDSRTKQYYDVSEINPKYSALRDNEGKAISVCACDMDGNGTPELYIHNHNDVYPADLNVAVQPDRLFKVVDGEYVDLFSLTEKSKTIAPRYGGHSVACVDRTGEGLYDIFVTTFTKDGKGTYILIKLQGNERNTSMSTDITELINLSVEKDGNGILVGPILPNDDISDILVTNEHSHHVGSKVAMHDGTDLLLSSNPDGIFVESSLLDDDAESSGGAAIVDLNNDGLFDIIVGKSLAPSKMFLQKSGETLTFQPYQSNSTFHSSSATDVLLTGDFDNDGHLDIVKSGVGDNTDDSTFNAVFTVRHQTNTSDFEIATSDIGFHHRFKRVKMKGIAKADLDDDGLPEIFITHESYNDKSISVFEGETNEFNWINILPLTKHGAPALGSVVTLTFGINEKKRVVIGGDCSYLCQSEPLGHFGLGHNTAKEFEVTWPDSKTIRRFLTYQDNKRTLRVYYLGNVEYVKTFSSTEKNASSIGITLRTVGFLQFTLSCILLYFANLQNSAQGDR